MGAWCEKRCEKKERNDHQNNFDRIFQKRKKQSIEYGNKHFVNEKQ